MKLLNFLKNFKCDVSLLSPQIGKKEYMRKCPEIFYSLTFAGETLSLAAAKSVMQVMDENNVSDVIKQNGAYFLNHVNNKIYLTFFKCQTRKFKYLISIL